MKDGNLKIIYEDDNVLVIDKPAGIAVFPEGSIKGETLIDLVLKNHPEVKNAGSPERYGIIHRLDKDTSGIILVAKSSESLIFFQKQFKNRTVFKKYIALSVGKFKDKDGVINTLIGRAPGERIKQKVYLPLDPQSEGKREAITEYKVLEQFENYTLLEITPKTGRKHQIRCHLAYLGHPIAGDKMYGFKNQPCPKGLNRHFLHASYLKINLLNGETKEFFSELPEDLNKIIRDLKEE